MFTRNDGWQTQLQIGDKVIEQYTLGTVRIDSVKNITPTQILLESGQKIDPETGRRKTSDKYNQTDFYPYTLENVRTFNLILARRRLANVDWAEVSDEEAWQIYQRVKHAIHK